MKNTSNILILLTFISAIGSASMAHADTKHFLWNWTPAHHFSVEGQKYNPYLENSRHIQVPQWAHNDWYAEDWTAQKDGMTLVKGFYNADILRDQIVGHNDLPVLIVGPNFYRLSGYDKRRIAHIVDVTYGITAQKENGAFMLRDWNTRALIGSFDQNGLRLH